MMDPLTPTYDVWLVVGLPLMALISAAVLLTFFVLRRRNRETLR